ncbi:MAG TPA: hypothetical protein PKY77_04040 [Phycisphaerae bacterium]|nr:hypothetical protein [Phycisphaerae bacterium]HRY67057.1 hypothetical protein [Phycisphaerae bacterium]HSA27754.1 hypothetical protein [Phycisphaerae bacterium]
MIHPTTRIRYRGVILALLGLCTGCAGPGPRLLPIAAAKLDRLADGTTERWYDVDGNGRPDYRERLSPAGLVARIGYDANEDGQIEEDVELAEVPANEIRHLVLILDSVPFDMVEEFWDQGRLRYFPRPTRVVSPFPVMTDPILSEFFGRAPLPGVEAEYFDGQKLTNGYATYAADGNTPWHADTDYYLTPSLHAIAYLWQRAWFEHELHRIQETYAKLGGDHKRRMVAYVVGTSALGAKQGRDGHAVGLITLDRFCMTMLHQTRGRIRISLFSDHGHDLVMGKRIALKKQMARLGYRVGDALRQPGDVVIPEFGLVTCAAIHTREPAQVARDVVNIDGMELAAYRGDEDSIVVVDRQGVAMISRSPAGFRYRVRSGDPLRLEPVLDQLRTAGKIDANGFVDDRLLFEATATHTYPDVVQRLWRAFHGLFSHVPDVFVSLEDGWYVGSPAMTKLLGGLRGAHGNLRGESSCGFATTMSGSLPGVVRMADLRAAFQAAGVPFEP